MRNYFSDVTIEMMERMMERIDRALEGIDRALERMDQRIDKLQFEGQGTQGQPNPNKIGIILK